MDNVIKEYVPFYNESNSTYPLWYSSQLISMIINKKKMHKLWLEFDILDDFIEFKRMRALCIRQSCFDRANYMEKVEFSSTKNIKKFWNYVNNLSKDSGIPEEMFLKIYQVKMGNRLVIYLLKILSLFTYKISQLSIIN